MSLLAEIEQLPQQRTLPGAVASNLELGGRVLVTRLIPQVESAGDANFPRKTVTRKVLQYLTAAVHRVPDGSYDFYHLVDVRQLEHDGKPNFQNNAPIIAAADGTIAIEPISFLGLEQARDAVDECFADTTPAVWAARSDAQLPLY